MPSFFLQMFKRGRYVSLRSLAAEEADEASQKEKPKHQERERFSVAAVAFCIEHDKAFKRHFLEVVTNLSADKIDKVTLEPDRCADLLLQGKQHIIVFEFKLGALLEDHQNPITRIFSERGYGARIRDKFAQAGKELRYIVIGKEFEPCSREGLHCFAVPWRSFLPKDRAEAPIEQDLYDCLGHLGAPVFLHRNMKNCKLNPEVSQAISVYKFLGGVLERLGVSTGQSDCDDETFGRKIPKAGGDPFQKKLVKAVQPKGQHLGWIGYGTDGNASHPAVGFYCSKETAQTIHKRLRAVKDLGETVAAGLEVWIDHTGDRILDDEEWFKKVLRTAAGC